ncbi:MAG: hemin transporter ATP-binding protein [Bacillus sp. (in: firmicutes)]|jgi:putative ABC transport system ATP-binding protein|nr:hemin transporter ATP-binding protein [Bacillus sp. (in: firmicutes)]
MSSIKFENVSKIYGEGSIKVNALKSASLEVNEGEFVAVVGPSGSGKSTFLAIAGALLKPSGGKVFINDQDISAFTEKELAKVRLHQIGFIFQTSNLVPYLRTRDQLLLVKKMKGRTSMDDIEKAEQLLIEIGLEHRLKQFPDQLSGGERQRVAIARAFMNDPSIILADEPTASLDSKRGQEVVQLLAQEVKTRNKAAIMVTHDERVLSYCDRIIHIEDGVVRE